MSRRQKSRRHKRRRHHQAVAVAACALALSPIYTTAPRKQPDIDIGPAKWPGFDLGGRGMPVPTMVNAHVLVEQPPRQRSRAQDTMTVHIRTRVGTLRPKPTDC